MSDESPTFEVPSEPLDLPGVGPVKAVALGLTEAIFFGEPGETPRARMQRMIARCVVREDGSPVMTGDDWERYGARHRAAGRQVAAVVLRLNGDADEGNA